MLTKSPPNYYTAHCLRIDYYVQKIWMLRSQWNSAQMNNWQPQNPRSRFGAIYLKNSTANPVHLPQKWAKWAELAVLFSW